jgi:tetratricopeptide (TPR) repeat protein
MPTTSLTHQPPDEAAQFVANIMRSVQAALTRVQRDETPTLTELTRARALHVLTFALKLPAAWSLTCQLMLALAPKLEQAGYREEWLPYLQRAMHLSEQRQDQAMSAEFLFLLGHLHRLRGEFALAQQQLTQSVALFEALRNDYGQARALNQLAYLAWLQHRDSEAETLANAALALLAPEDAERATSLSALGMAAINQGHWQEAEQYHRTALELRTRHNLQRERAWSLQNLGYSLRGQGDFAGALACYEEAMAKLEELGDRANWAIVRMNMGIVYSLQKEPQRALATYAEAEQVFRQIGDQWYVAKVLVNQGIDYMGLREWTKAEWVLRHSANLFEQIGELSEHLNALDGVAMTRQGQGFYEEALALFRTVKCRLPEIEGTHYHRMLSRVIDKQLTEAKAAVAQAKRDDGK